MTSRYPILHRMAHSTDGHARIIHNAIMSHPACEFVKLGALFESFYTSHTKCGTTIPQSRCMAAEELLEVLDMLADRFGMVVPPREPLPHTHQKYKGVHPAHYRNRVKQLAVATN